MTPPWLPSNPSEEHKTLLYYATALAPRPEEARLLLERELETERERKKSVDDLIGEMQRLKLYDPRELRMARKAGTLEQLAETRRTANLELIDKKYGNEARD